MQPVILAVLSPWQVGVLVAFGLCFSSSRLAGSSPVTPALSSGCAFARRCPLLPRPTRHAGTRASPGVLGYLDQRTMATPKVGTGLAPFGVLAPVAEKPAGLPVCGQGLGQDWGVGAHEPLGLSPSAQQPGAPLPWNRARVLVPRTAWSLDPQRGDRCPCPQVAG